MNAIHVPSYSEPVLNDALPLLHGEVLLPYDGHRFLSRRLLHQGGENFLEPLVVEKVLVPDSVGSSNEAMLLEISLPGGLLSRHHHLRRREGGETLWSIWSLLTGRRRTDYLVTTISNILLILNSTQIWNTILL